MKRAILLAASLGLTIAALPLVAEEAPAAAAASDAAPATQQGSVARAILTTAISEREPVDQVESVGADATSITLFTELRGMQGERVTHRWEYNGQVVSEVGFDVKSNRWRVWSNKSLQPVFAGKWTVSVVNSAGEVLVTRDFQYGGQ